MEYLRQFIREVIKEESSSFTGAGIIVVKQGKDGLRFLGLKTQKGFDIPKGGADPGETPMETALRETFEEASLSSSDLKFQWEKPSVKLNGRLILFLASTNSTPAIGINPKTKEKEHDGFEWLSFEDIEKSCLSYLKPAIRWAISVILNKE